jgi:hypothetical protein
MAGVWTKVLTADGNPFYYNASLDQSLWAPPLEAVVHEAPALQYHQSIGNSNGDDGTRCSEMSGTHDEKHNFDGVDGTGRSSSCSSSSSSSNTAAIVAKRMLLEEAARVEEDAPIDVDVNTLIAQRSSIPMHSNIDDSKARTSGASSKYKQMLSELSTDANEDSGQGSKWLVR